MTKNGNGDKIWRWKKSDVLFVVGIAIMVYGGFMGRIDVIIAGGGVIGLPFTIRGDKG